MSWHRSEERGHRSRRVTSTSTDAASGVTRTSSTSWTSSCAGPAHGPTAPPRCTTTSAASRPTCGAASTARRRVASRSSRARPTSCGGSCRCRCRCAAGWSSTTCRPSASSRRWSRSSTASACCWRTSSGPACSCSSSASWSTAPSSSTRCPATTTRRGERERGDVSGHVDALAHQHLRRAADVAFAVFQEQHFEHLCIGAPDEIASELEQLLHPYLRSRLCGRIDVQPDASHDEVRGPRSRSRPSRSAARRPRWSAACATRSGSGRRGVAGLDAVLAALAQHRVEHLLVSDGYSAPGWVVRRRVACSPPSARAARRAASRCRSSRTSSRRRSTRRWPTGAGSRCAGATPTSTCWAASARCSASRRRLGPRLRARPRRHEAARGRRRHRPARARRSLEERVPTPRGGEADRRRDRRPGRPRSATRPAGTRDRGRPRAPRPRRPLRHAADGPEPPGRGRPRAGRPAARAARSAGRGRQRRHRGGLGRARVGRGARARPLDDRLARHRHRCRLHREGRGAAGGQRLRRRARPHGRRPRPARCCPCGQRGCWERYASGSGLGRLAREAAHAGVAAALVERAGGEPEDVRGEHVTDAGPRRRSGRPGGAAAASRGGSRSGWPTWSTSSTRR